jgi:predicted Zn-dependent protease
MRKQIMRHVPCADRRARFIPVLAVLALVACAVSTQQELALGREYAAEIDRQLPLVQDAAANQYINSLGNQIARHGRSGLTYSFKIVNSKVVNAFAVPGGYVYVNRGLVERAANVSELAAVLAHEIAHVEERHSAEQLGRVQSTNVGLSLAYVLLGRRPSGLERTAINVGGGLVFARYSRAAEDEADAAAIPLLIAAGIHPNGMVTFFQKLIADQRRSPSALEQWFSTHPTASDRAERTRDRIARIPAGQLRGLLTDSERFRNFKAGLKRYAAPQR